MGAARLSRAAGPRRTNLITSNPDLYTAPLGLALFVTRNRTSWDMLMAGSVIATLPMVLVFLVFQRQFIRGISLSGLKA